MDGCADGGSGYRPLRTPQQMLQQEQARHDVTRMALQVAQHQLESLKLRVQEGSELLSEAQEHGSAAWREVDDLRASMQQQLQQRLLQTPSLQAGAGADMAAAGDTDKL